MVNHIKSLINKSVKITLKDKRTYTGTILSADEFMNIILTETSEYRKFKHRNGGEMRELGLCLFRGNSIINVLKIENDDQIEKE